MLVKNMLSIHGLDVVNVFNAKDMEHHCGPFTAENIGVTVDGGYGEYFLVKHSKYLFDAGDTPDELAGTYACRGLTAYSALKKLIQKIKIQ